MGSVRRLTIVIAVALVAALITGAGLYVGFRQAADSDGLRRDFANRASLAADLTSSTLVASDSQNRQFAEEFLAGPDSTLQTALAKETTATEFAVVLGSDGEVLASVPAPLADDAARAIVGDTRARALQSGTIAFGNYVSDQVTGKPVAGPVMTVAYSSSNGIRLLTQMVPLEVLQRFTDGYLAAALNVAGGRAQLIDGQNNVIATTGTEPIGRQMTDRALASRLAYESTGTVNGNYYAAAAVQGTPWRIVFSASGDAVLNPTDSTRQVSWQLFGAFVAAVACLVALAVTALRRSARLAHAHLHDGLTGLPNRALWMDRVQQALDKRSKEAGLAVLFLDLDGFKAVNDTYGHSAGDALLVDVAERLRATTRRGDIVGRFGGDEFLVLGTDLAPASAVELAYRVRASIAEPMDVAGRRLTIGVSIGIASPDSETVEADALVHRADLAMYRAKERESGVACFDGDTATPTVGPEV
ncbi:sensor domain-containing diguanylate cyclase [Asanoa siamensis]|uniref:GGDEF domain-containing protein n=1 Tax=Asanoa siamensis TaxID=926357 RepID=A0ABQ4D3V4_9ACTN|nr:sensor domain-containing diguanylate cyclase [Asanoa siamensis]GIF78213.1 hypothetical protein Asi02nite_77310 [Asanoa siamensis]